MVLEEIPHELFSRQGNDVIYTLAVSFPDLVLGTKVDVPTLDGAVKLTIPPSTQPETMLRIPGHGIGLIKGSGRGDQYVKVNVFVPKDLSHQDKELLKEMKKSSGIAPSAHNDKDAKSFFEKARDIFS